MDHRKNRRKGSAERFLSVLLAVVMVLSLAPENMLTLAANAEGTDAGLCEHHTEHTADCGYREAAPCTHEHTGECYTEKTSCVHEHNADCYSGELPAEGEDREADACTHVCTEDSGCVTKELNCTHEHDDSCGYAEAAPCGYVCEICNGEETDGGQETPESGIEGNATEENKAEEDAIGESGTGESVSENGNLKEDIPVEGTDAEEGLCPHHEQHTEDCGYGETTPCGYECKICPVQNLIDALPDESEITAENAADVEKQLAEIDEAKAELTDEELDELDTARYEVIVSALLALEGMEKANELELLEGTGVFTVTGGTPGTDYSYANGVLTIKTGTALTIGGTSISDRIEVESGVNANITLNNVSIDVSGIEGAAAFKIADNSTGNVTVTLEGTNVLKSGADCAGLQKNGESGVGTLTITGSGSLNAVGGGNGAGIGGSGTDSRTGPGGSTANITIENGTITAQGGADTVDTGIEGFSPEYGGAGIGGGANGSGSNITITGGTVNATGGAGSSGGAGIGGGKDGSGSVIIRGSADVKAQGGTIAAGIGAGCNSSINAGHSGTVTIEGGTVIATGGTNSNFGGAGIGAGYSSHANVTITGGTVTATGGSSAGRGSGGAGIGSSGGIGNATVKISGGTVIAKGGDDENGGAGIGGGASNYAVNVTISGGTVTATGGSNVSSDGSGGPGAGIGLNAGGRGSATFSTTGDSGASDAFIIAAGGTGNTPGDGITNGVSNAGNGLIVNGETTVWGASSYTLSQSVEIPSGATLTISNGKTLTVNETLTNNGTLLIEKGGTLSGGTLNGNGNFVTTELTEDMITVPTGLFYDGTDRTNYIEQNTTLATKTYCGKEFHVTGWTQSVAKTSDLEYTVTYTSDGGEAVTKTVLLGQSGTNLSAELANPKNTYAYTDTITINATVTPSGKAPNTPAMLTATFDEPTAGQVAVYEGDTQVCAPATPENGVCTFTIPAKDLEPGSHTFTVKYIGTSAMAEAAKDLTVTVAACPHTEIDATGACTVCKKAIAATVETGGITTRYTDITTAWNYANGKTATITMLTNQVISQRLEITSGNLTLTMKDGATLSGDCDLIYVGGGTLKLDGCNLEVVDSIYTHRCLWVDNRSAVVDITNCSMTSKANGGYAVRVVKGTVNIHSGTFQGAGYGLYIHTGSDAKVNLYGGTFTGASKAIWINSSSSQTLGDLLADGYAYKKSDNTWVQSDTLNAKEITDTVTVLPVPVRITWQPTNATATYGTSASLSIEAAATEPGNAITYQWLDKDGNAINGATAASYTPTGLDVGTYTYSCNVTCDGYTLKSDSVTVTVNASPLQEIALSQESVTYNGNEQKPAVTAPGLTENTDYEISYTRNGTVTDDFTNAGEITITVTGKGNYKGTAVKTYTINKAAPQIAWGSTSQTVIYTGKAAVITAPTVTLTGSETFSGTITYSDVKSGADYTVLPAEVGTYKIKARIAASENYIAAETADTLTLTIKYYDGEIPVKFTANGNELAETAWVSPATKVTISADGFAIAAVAAGGARPAADGITGSNITMPAGDVAGKTFYFKQTQPNTGYMTDGIQYTLKVDDNPPGGRIELKYKFWDSFLSVISFGHYQATDKAVKITTTDNESGIKTTEYVIVTGGTSYATKEALEAANLSWQTYNSGSKPAVGVNTKSVIYARLTDNAGNVTYISSDGILMDTEAPKISSFNIAADSVTDEKAQMSMTVDEMATIYLVAVPAAEAGGIQAKDVIATCDVNAIGAADGSPIDDAIVAWKGMLAADSVNLTGTKDVTGLAPSTAYTVYAVAVDKVIDMDNSTDSKIVYTGNVSPLSSTTLTTKKAQPVIAKEPVLSGTYGQAIKDMLIPGTVKDKSGAVLEGTWTVSTADQNKTPSVGTTEEITVTFTPGDAAYDTISVKITPRVNPRSLSAEGVDISQVAGTYTYNEGAEIKPPVALGTGGPTEGVYISDSRAVLTANDFTVSYSNNKNAGTATVTITGWGNYTGSVTRDFTIGKAAGRVIPDLTGTQTNNGQEYTYTITPIEGAVYRKGDDGAWMTVGQEKGNVFTDITPGTTVTFYAKMPGNENYEEGDAKSITVTFEKLTPAAPALAYTVDRTASNMKITITYAPGAEYSFDGGQNWGDANEQDGFNSSQTVTLAIRLKETDTHNPSKPQIVKVNLAKEDREAPGPFKLKYEANGERDYTVTIPPTEGCEYSFDGVTWSDENVKTGVKAGEIVTGYKRYKETNEYNASSAVSDTETMPKFTVKTPVISPAGGIYAGSVSVTITCASPDAVIYYTTDGNIPTRSSIRYTGAFTVTPTATVRAIAIREGLTDSVVATVQYTKKDSGSGETGAGGSSDNGGSFAGGNSGGNGSGSESESNSDNDAGNTAPAAPAGPHAAANPGTGTTATPATPGTGNTAGPGSQTKPGSGNTERPGSQTEPGNGSSQETGADTEKPFIKGADGKIGWDVIRAEEEKAAGGSVINVDMNGATVVPGDIFDSIRGRDITVTFDMDNGIVWSVDGKSITTDQAGDIDFSVKTGADIIPVDIVNNVTGESYSIQISLAHEGEFGFTAVLFINLGSENAGYTASLYYYNESTGELEFICRDTITEDGTASLAFTHASDYVIAIDEEESAATESMQPQDSGESAGNDDTAAEETPETTQTWRPWWIVVAGILVIVVGIGLFFAGKRKKKE